MEPVTQTQKQMMTLGISAFAAMALSACQLFQPSAAEESSGNPQGVTVELEISTAALAKAAANVAPRPTDSTVITVSAPDMSARQFGFGSADSQFTLNDLTPGTNRLFTIQLLRQGRVLYAGEADTTLYADRKNTLFLHCLPRFSRVAASVHIPVDFPRSIGQGSFRLWNGGDTLTAVMDREGEFLAFELEEVPGDLIYSASLSLWDSSGALVAQSVLDTLSVPMGQNVSFEMPLVTTFSQLQIGLEISDPNQTSLAFSFPAGKRIPAAFGEMIFSELYPAPAYEDSGSLGEWLELYNRTSDTLDISGCNLLRDGGGTASKQAAFPPGTLVPPGRAWVVGHKYAPSVNVLFNSFTLTNSLAKMELSCRDGALQLDTLTYSLSAADSTAIPARDGKVTSLRPADIAQRVNPNSWCLVPAHPDSASEGEPTPGTLEDGCGS